MPRRRFALTVAALGLLGACGRGGGVGSDDAALHDGEIIPHAADTVAVAPRADIDGPGPADGSAEKPADGPAGADEAADTTARAPVGDSAAVSAPPVELRVPAGTRVRLSAETDISTDVYEVGDPVIATVVRDVLDRTGEILIPQGAYFLGRVEASAGSGGIGEPPVLEVAFETLSAWNYERPVEGVVVDAAVTLDPVAGLARRAARGRLMRAVPGRIMAGSIIVLRLREPVFVPPFDPSTLQSDSTESCC